MKTDHSLCKVKHPEAHEFWQLHHSEMARITYQSFGCLSCQKLFWSMLCHLQYPSNEYAKLIWHVSNLEKKKTNKHNKPTTKTQTKNLTAERVTRNSDQFEAALLKHVTEKGM